MTSKLFLRIIATYVLICIIPIITGLLTYNSAVKTAEKQTVRLTSAALERAASSTDNALSKIDTITQNLLVDNNILRMLSSKPIKEDSSANFNMKEAYETIRYNERLSESLLDLVLYCNKPDVVITSTHMFISLSRYYGSFFTCEDIDIDRWSTNVLNDPHYSFYMPVRSIMMRTGTENSDVTTCDAIMYIHSVRSQSGWGKIIALISTDIMSDALSDIFDTYTDGGVVVFDSTGQEIATLGSVTDDIRSESKQVLSEQYATDEFIVTNDGSKVFMIAESKLGWHFVAALNSDQILKDTNYIKRTVYIMVAIEVAMLLLLAVAFAWRNFKPVKNLVSLVGSVDTNSGSADDKSTLYKNEYDYLRQMITLMKRNYTSANSQLDAQMQILGKQLVAERLHGDMPENVLRDSFEQVRLQYPEDDATIALFMTESGNNRDVSGDVTRIMLNEQLAIIPREIAVYTRLDEDRYALVIYQDKYVQRELLERINKVFADTECVLPKVTVFPYDGIHTLRQRYKYADMRVHRWDAEPGVIDWVRTYETLRSTNVHYSVKTEEKIIRLTKSGACAELKTTLEGVAEKNRECLKEQPETTTLLMNAFQLTCARIQREAQFTAADGEKDIINIDPVSAISESEPVEDFYVWCMRAAEQIDRQRKDIGNRRTMEPICEFIKDNFTDKQISLAMVAEKFNLSETYLSRLFKAQMGVNYSEYLERLRIQRACELLDQDQSVETVADETGYNSVTVFRAAFKRICGMNPSVYKTGGRSIED